MYSISFQEESLLPRERLVRLGAEQLSNQELLSILIRTGNKKENVFQIASRILASVSSLTELRHMTLSELQEHLVALYLNTQNQIIHQQTIFIGSLTRSLAEPREILHYAIKHMATSIILVHNHPSGATRPSRDDDQVTEKIKEACEMMGFVLLDHLIVGGDSYYSYREETDLI